MLLSSGVGRPGFGMTKCGFKWLGLAGALCLAFGFIFAAADPALARGPCLADGAIVTGQLQQVHRRLDAGHPIDTLHVVLRRPICVVATLADGTPGEIDRVRAVQFVPAGSGLDLADLVGREISIAGSFGEPHTAYHTGDAVMFEARVVAVDDRGQTRRDLRRHARAFDDDRPFNDQWRSRMGDGGSDQDGYKGDLGHQRRDAEFRRDTGYRREFRADYRTAAQGDDMSDRIARFVSEHYLGSEALTSEQIRGIYADRVDYFGERKRREQIVVDKAAYYRRWPQRDYRLLPETLEIQEIAPGVYDVAFEFYFQVGGKGRRSSGHGAAQLTLDLGRGDGRITREGGEVLER